MKKPTRGADDGAAEAAPRDHVEAMIKRALADDVYRALVDDHMSRNIERRDERPKLETVLRQEDGTHVVRLWTPHGWLVTPKLGVPFTYVPDANHVWLTHADDEERLAANRYVNATDAARSATKAKAKGAT